MNLRRIGIRLALGAPLALLLACGAARAAVAFDVAVGMNVNEDTRIFLNVTNQVWQPAAPTAIIQRCRYPEDDFPVVAFLAFQSHRDPNFILQLRAEGYPWADIFYRVHVDPGVLFVGMDRDPGPPYGRAWGYWRNHPRGGPQGRLYFSDRDVVGLVKVQTAARHFGASPYSVLDAQHQGRRVEVYTAGRWREKHGRDHWSEGRGDQAGPGRGHGDRGHQGGNPGHGDEGKGHGKGHGNGHGNDKGNDHDR